jgi:hypothetical protein
MTTRGPAADLANEAGAPKGPRDATAIYTEVLAQAMRRAMVAAYMHAARMAEEQAHEELHAMRRAGWFEKWKRRQRYLALLTMGARLRVFADTHRKGEA